MTSSAEALAHVLSGERHEIEDAKAGRISYYVDGPADDSDSHALPPLLLIHTINASASAHEIKPLFDHHKQYRRTYAIDLPGYGHSERSDRTYDQRLMVDAVHALLAEIRSQHQALAIDAMAVSLSCEFLAKAALEKPESIRSLALVSPTGFARYASTKGPPEADCRRPGVLKFLQLPLVGKTLFSLLTRPWTTRFYLRKTWGRKEIDEQFFQTSTRLSQLPNAERVPFYFISGYLFSAHIMPVYKQLSQPVWLAHGVRGDFSDFSRKDALTDSPNWQITEFQTGALPYYEVPDAFDQAYTDFLEGIRASQA